MSTVWKFPFKLDDEIVVDMPRGAEILHVGQQADYGVIWARVEPDQPKEQRRFNLRGTGHPDANGTYVGTFMTHGNSLVWHLFEK